MEKFDTLKSIPAHMPLSNIDTDMIIPKQFLKTIKRTGLGKNLFYEMRYDEKGNLIENFILNKKPFNESKIILAGKNFGCGSSREHAPWALLDFGIKCVIANSFADIFYNNCFKNGLLPIVLSQDDFEAISARISEQNNQYAVSLENQLISCIDFEIKFEIDKRRKHVLLEGIDDISETLKLSKKIKNYEDSKFIKTPWIFNG